MKCVGHHQPVLHLLAINYLCWNVVFCYLHVHSYEFSRLQIYLFWQNLYKRIWKIVK